MVDDQGGVPSRPRGRIRAPQDFAAGVSLVAVSSFALWASADLVAGRMGALGPGMLPRAIAVTLGLAGAALVAGSFAWKGDPLARLSLRGPLFVVLGVVGFALTVRSPGLVVAGPLVVMVGGAASPETRYRELALFALVITAFCVGLFRYVLHLPVPILVIPGLVTI